MATNASQRKAVSDDDQTSLSTYAQYAAERAHEHEEDCLCDGTGEVNGRLCWHREAERAEANARTFDVPEELDL